MEPKFDSLVCDRLIPGLGTPGVPGCQPQAGDRYLGVFSSSFVVRLASAASPCAQLQGAHVHGHGHVVPRARRAEWKRSGTDRAGWQRAVGPVLRTATLAAVTRFHHRQGRADSVYRRETTNERTNRATGTRTRIRRGRAGGLERAEVAGALRPDIPPVHPHLVERISRPPGERNHVPDVLDTRGK